MISEINLLLIEDYPEDAYLFREYLKESKKYAFNIFEESTLAGGQTVLGREDIHIVLLDLNLIDSNGLETFEKIFEAYPNYPYIVLTGSDDEQLGVEAVRKGAQDFLEKNELTYKLLNRAVDYSLGRFEFKKEKNRMLAHLESAYQLAAMGRWDIDVFTNEMTCSPQVYNIFERDAQHTFNTIEAYLKGVHPDDQEKVARELFKVFTTQKDFATEHRIVLEGGKEKYIVFSGRMVLENGKPINLVGNIQDITERKTIEKLTREKELSQKSFRVRQEFLAKTSHEIRTPLNPILGLTDILLNRTNPTEEQIEYLNAIKTAGGTLLALVNDLLDYAKVEAGKIDFNSVSFSIKKLLVSLKEMMEINLKDKLLKLRAKSPGGPDVPLALVMDFDEDVPPMVIGDQVRLSQILLNLVSNAIKFTDEGEIRVSAKVIEKREKDVLIRFKVEDTGIGIPKDKLSLIFESFRQVDSNMNRKYGGVGLGLTIVRQLVVLQGGEIFVDSLPNKGSVFGFDLRFDIDHENLAEKEEVPVEEVSLNGMEILLVEDNETNQIVTQNILAGWGIKSDIANNGLECIRLLEGKNYDLVLMDIQMPEMDGYEATKYIRNNFQPPNRDITIIALTANAFSGIDDRCLQIGMNDYLSKPVNANALLGKIKQYVDSPTTVNGGNAVEPITFRNASIMEKQKMSNGRDAAPVIDPPYTDLSYLKNTLKDDSIVKRTILKFIETTPKLLDELDKNLQGQEYMLLSKCAHKLKSSAETLGIHSLKETILNIEQSAKNKQDVEALPAQVHKVRSVIQLAFSELEEKASAL